MCEPSPPTNQRCKLPGERFTSLLNKRQKAFYHTLVAIWLGALVFFWQWWLEPAHNIGTLSYVIITFLLAWITLCALYFIAVSINAKAPTAPLQLPQGSRIAMVVTKTPSEPFDVVAETLEAMLGQDHPRDVWLADEDPSYGTLEWCKEREINICSRKGIADYHRDCWPRRTRCKEGNLAYFYDTVGYESYDFVVQMDADHVPSPTYLREMLRPFSDPNVGYVSAPSICDKNAEHSWAARGRLYVEGTLHGVLQAGYNSGWAPLCIGSHYAVRTQALKEIGGLGPELAEDHSTTLMMNAGGWRGAHAVNAIAHGDGPNTFADLVTQEFQWSRSLVSILLRYSPELVPKLPFRLRFQFIFSQLWYPLFAISMSTMFILPVMALVMGSNFVGVTFAAFIGHFIPIGLSLIAITYFWERQGWFRPYNAKTISWEGTLFLLARWPWAAAGTLAALRDWLTGSFVEFRITPKGRDKAGPLPVRVLAPYFFLSLFSVLPVLAFEEVSTARGFYIFATLNAIIYAIVLIAILVRHAIENNISPRTLSPRFFLQSAAIAVLLFLPVSAFNLRGAEGLEALAHGAGNLRMTKASYSVSGAGRGRAGRRILTISPRWVSDKQ